jgi:hypothetical protein
MPTQMIEAREAVLRLALALHEADIDGCDHQGGYAGLIADHRPFAERILLALAAHAEERGAIQGLAEELA